MSIPALTWLYRKLGSRYPIAFVAFELQSAILIAAGTVALLSLYYEPTKAEFLWLAAGVGLGTFLIMIAVIFRIRPHLRPIEEWIAGDRDEKATLLAWEAAVTLPLGLIRNVMPLPFLVNLVPGAIGATFVLADTWVAFFPIFGAGMIALGYAIILHYLALEAGMRPVLIDINRSVSPRLSTESKAIPLRFRLMAALPMINVITGVVVAALTSDGNSGVEFSVDVLIALAVATTISLELTLLLSKSILRPIEDLREATEAVREGRFDHQVPVTTGDELGELAASFNQMLHGLSERERLREAFGTYLDKQVAEYILSEGFDEEGAEVDATIVFIDVIDFTRFAAEADAREVVYRLNELFELAVPIVNRNGGHIDKFEGDGLMAVFGPPENRPDHADRAVRAACEIATKANVEGRGPFRISAGASTGRVVAGSIGGGGRLNFSVIGDPVNVAARVEAATRQTGDQVLISEATRAAMTTELPLLDRGPVELKGLSEPVRLFAPLAEARSSVTEAVLSP